MQFFNIHQGETEPQYTINLMFVVDINREEPESWEVTTTTGAEYTLEDDDLKRFRKSTGL